MRRSRHPGATPVQSAMNNKIVLIGVLAFAFDVTPSHARKTERLVVTLDIAEDLTPDGNVGFTGDRRRGRTRPHTLSSQTTGLAGSLATTPGEWTPIGTGCAVDTCALQSRTMTSQSIHRPAGINVYGSYLVRVDPDFATLDFSVNATEATARSAFAKAREAAAAVRSFIGSADIPDADVRTSQMSLQQAFEYQAGQQRAIGFTASIGFQVILEALDRVELLLAGVVEAGANRVDRVAFRTSRMREVRADARREAFARARAKAEIFAAAAGVKLGHVLHVEDVNADEGERRHHAYAPDQNLSDEESVRAPTNPGSNRRQRGGHGVLLDSSVIEPGATQYAAGRDR